MEIKLLKRLSQENGLSIAKLSSQLKVDSLTILKHIGEINQLEPELLINHNGQYFLKRQLEWLDQARIDAQLRSHDLNYTITLLDQTNSTNNYALNHISHYSERGLISCEWQFAGRGRFGRRWLSSIARDITASIIRVFPADYNLGVLPLLCAVAINRLLKDHKIRNQIKWPNDIYVAGSKVAGVLVENLVRQQHNHTVIGIGIDNFADFSRNQLLAELVIALEKLLAEFEMFGFALLRREWLDNCWHLNQVLTIYQNEQEICQGVHRDISELGELIIETASGIQKFSSSSISIKFASLESRT